MNKVALLSAAGAVALGASPAFANITIFATPGAVQPAENVLFQSADPVGSTAFGVTNKSSTQVTFTGTEALSTPSRGQARIEAADGAFGSLSFFLTDTDLGFDEVEFNIFGTKATATSVDLAFTDDLGAVFSRSFAIGNGQNFFSALASDGRLITNVSITLNGNVADMRHFRLGGIAEVGGVGVVPEPATWAMMIGGFGLVGAAARRLPKRAYARA